MPNLGLTYANSSVSASAATALAANNSRKYFYFHNTHATQTIYGKFGATAASGEGFVIKAGETLEFGLLGGPCPIDYFSVYGSGSTTTYCLAEGT